MVVPQQTVSVQQGDGGFRARTSLLPEIEGAGSTDAEARANLDHAARVWLKRARDTGQDIPEEFRISTAAKITVIAVFLLAVAVVRLIVHYVSS